MSIRLFHQTHGAVQRGAKFSVRTLAVKNAGRPQAAEIWPPIRRMAVAGAVLRTSLALFYHLHLYVSRYYMVACALLWPLSARLSAGALAMHLPAGIVQYLIRRPRFNPLSFLVFFFLDQAAYLFGVSWSCCHRMFFKPLLPKPVFSLTSTGSTKRKRGN